MLSHASHVYVGQDKNRAIHMCQLLNRRNISHAKGEIKSYFNWLTSASSIGSSIRLFPQGGSSRESVEGEQNIEGLTTEPKMERNILMGY